jgi:hypothetical protein
MSQSFRNFENLLRAPSAPPSNGAAIPISQHLLQATSLNESVLKQLLKSMIDQVLMSDAEKLEVATLTNGEDATKKDKEDCVTNLKLRSSLSGQEQILTGKWTGEGWLRP